MEEGSDYIQVNKSNWDDRTRLHLDSEFYDVKGFINGCNSLNEIELALLGDVKDKTLLHLQCHFGMDTLSLSRMGAMTTGVDFSELAINEARKLNQTCRLNAEFVCSDVYQLDLGKEFDIVFSSYGVIGWLPELTTWAKVISKHLRPGGTFVFAEFHPVVWMFDNQFNHIEYRYFNSKPIKETETGTYADRNSKQEIKSVTWNHSLHEVIDALLQNGLSIRHFREYDYSPYNCFENTSEFEKGRFRIQHLSDKIPMVYSLIAVK